MTDTLLCTPLRVEHAALRGDGPLQPMRTGRGQRRSLRRARGRADPTAPMLVAGVCGAVSEDLRPGDLVVATEVVTEGRPRVTCPSAPLLAGTLRRLGLTVHLGTIATTPRIAAAAVRERLGVNGVLAVDMESGYLATGAVAAFAVVRAVVDAPDHPLWRMGTVNRGVVALRSLRQARPALQQWAAATGAREVSLVDGLEWAQLVLVAGSGHSRHSRTLAERAEAAGIPVCLFDGPEEFDLGRLDGVRRISMTTGTGCSPYAVDEFVRCLRGLGPVSVRDSPKREVV